MPTKHRLDVGKALETTVLNLEANSNYLFYVVAYKANGTESNPSNKLVYSPPALSRVKLVPSADGAMSIQFHAAVGSLCRIEYSSTMALSDWHTLGSLNADANGDVALDDPLADHPLMRFYRGVLIEP